MKSAVRRVLLLSALMSPSALYALGLGEIRLNSALNQPFDAEIELVS
ncbi:MAG: pilus assembly protein FimV, partial [Pseudomonadota bacterium]|nr:pilus assembly protein FimV [Pseudomonadota bacterium]